MSFFSPERAPRSAYIHWPFCPYKCHFCPFVALASHDQFMQRYHEALTKEIDSVVLNEHKGTFLDTIFFGGGTPSTYPNELLLDMFGILKKNFTFDATTEITVEVNPGTVIPGQLELWKSLGINRLSIGVQSLKDNVLKALNRHQKAEDVYRLLHDAQHHFDALSVDLILGLPDVTHDEWKDLMRKVVLWPVNHVSVYFLTVHEHTPLYFNVEKRKVILPCDDTVVSLYHWTCDMLAQHGFEQYELSNFARRGYESRHNRAYWNRDTYYGFGLGACSFDGIHRFQNEKNLLKYMTHSEKGESVISFCEKLSAAQEYLEQIMLGLRQRSGLPWDIVLKPLTEKEKKRVTAVIKQLCDDAFLIEREGVLLLTAAGLVVENQIIKRLSLQE